MRARWDARRPRHAPQAGARLLRCAFVTKFYFLGRDAQHAIEACCVEPEA